MVNKFYLNKNILFLIAVFLGFIGGILSINNFISILLAAIFISFIVIFRYPVVGFVMFLFSINLIPGYIYDSYTVSVTNNIRLNYLPLLLVPIIFIFLIKKKNVGILLKNKVDLYMIIFIFLLSLNALFSVDTINSIELAINWILEMITVYFGIRILINVRKDLPIIANSTIWISLVVSSYGIAEYVITENPLFHNYLIDMNYFDTLYTPGLSESYRISSFMGHPVVLGLFLVIYIPFILHKLIKTKRNFNRCLYVLVLLINLLAIFLTYSRFSLFVAIFIICVFFINKNKKILIGILCLFIFVFSYVPVDIVDKALERVSIQNILTSGSYLHRLYAYSTSLSAMVDRPILGYGLGQYAHAYEDHKQPGDVFFPVPDNTYLLILVELGIFSLMFFVAICINAIKALWRYNEEDEEYSWTLFCVLIAFLMNGISFDTFNFPGLRIWFFVILALSINNSEFKKNKRKVVNVV
ncbi:O-antigen ligase [Bacillus sp. FJAT-27445]|uniref:O-antigen ligase family protein n=1 Tax=Bacillus sp. FJAT-27445 TaxID=1679166 RepID=UPI00074432AD|nr:O-antigen ligase family protein [Bacillus sp. FJAT-27445]